jgi:hypothetical protein
MAYKFPFNITALKKTLQPFVSRKISRKPVFCKFCDNVLSHHGAKPRPAVTPLFHGDSDEKTVPFVRFVLVNPENDERLKDTIHLQSSIKSSRCWMTSRSNFSLASLSYEKYF